MCESGAPSPPLTSVILGTSYWSDDEMGWDSKCSQCCPHRCMIHSNYRKRAFPQFQANILFPSIAVNETVIPKGQDMGGIWAPRGPPRLCPEWPHAPGGTLVPLILSDAFRTRMLGVGWLTLRLGGFCVQGPGFPMSWNPQSCPERTQMSMASMLKNIGWSTSRFLSKLKILWLEIRDTSWTMKMRND